MNINNDLVLATAVNTLIRILEKYNKPVANEQAIQSGVQELATYGNAWFYAYCEHSRIVDKDVMYPNDAREEERQSSIMDDMENSIQKMPSRAQIYSMMASGKLLLGTLSDKSKKYLQTITELSEQQSKFETDCENIKDSYLDAGISELIIDNFVKSQNPEYSTKVKEASKIRKQVEGLEHKHEGVRKDEKALISAIETIETRSKLKYTDPDTNKDCYKYDYDQALKQLMEQQKNKG